MIFCYDLRRTVPGGLFGRVLHVVRKHRTSASFCIVSNIDIILKGKRHAYSLWLLFVSKVY